MISVAAPEFIERWDNEKCLHVGLWIGSGWSTKQVEAELGDGTTAESIRSRLQKIGYYALNDKGLLSVTFNVTIKQRSLLQSRANQRGLSLGEYIRRLAVCASYRRATFDQIVAGDQFY